MTLNTAKQRDRPPLICAKQGWNVETVFA